ncbi:hypothetical protein GH5_03118 [Leishmania sp. Ghana 2012 LV757]|uniref:hypothetical protein n=1 Tax=Leishmania sp. Ghana 2012 LV757 TaxID=2803181 RepID=UPI001B616528|nr:hypothetical protein GH5_03118 [Leishmania sp. Ghana 2012 LV757]
MSEHPEKRKWKEAHPHGLSASQFGMALGFCGRVSDYVHYLRDVVGTEHEFKGNAFTAHGIHTEPKSRALYELLTGCRVHDGGFFVTRDRVLGCSPDGQIFCSIDDQPIERQGALSASPMTAPCSASRPTCCYESCSGDFGVSSDSSAMERQLRSGGLSVRVPFKSKRRPRPPLSAISARSSRNSGPLARDEESDSCKCGKHCCSIEGRSATAHPDTLVCADQPLSTCVAPPSRHRVRLLEIKSPFRALYDSSKPGYQPFGIPMHYMCQIQGQLAIADCEECDFFVYLDHPACQVEGWRVRRSRAFWAWAEPNLRCVSRWIKDGPPDWLNRSFAFTDFDFRAIEVVPLIFPFDITATAALTDARRFAFFAQFPNPFETLDRHREARGDGGRQMQEHDWCFSYAGSTWADLAEWERIAVAAQTPAVQRLFAPAQADAGDSDDFDAKVELWSRLSSWRRALELEGVFEDSATAAFWKEWTLTAAAGRDPLVKVTLSVPDDWDTGRVVVRCSLPPPPRDQVCPLESIHDTASLRFYHRLFFASLLSDDLAAPHECATALGAARSPAYATPLRQIPLFSEPVALSPQSVEPARRASSPAEMCVQVSSAGSSSVTTAAPSLRRVSTCTETSPSVVCLSARDLSPSPQRVVAALSQLLHKCQSPQPFPPVGREDQQQQRAQRVPDELSVPLPDASATRQQSSRRPWECVSGLTVATLPAFSPSQCSPLLCEITAQDLLDVIRFADDCDGVVLASRPPEPLRFYKKQRDTRHLPMSGATDGPRMAAGSLLLVGESAVVQQLLHMSAKVSSRRVSRINPLQRVMDRLGTRAPSRPSLVPCFVESAVSSSSNIRETIQDLGGIPCFVVRADTDATTVLAQTLNLVREWKGDT